MKNLLARVYGSLAFAALLMHVGQHLQTETGESVGAGDWTFVGLVFVLAVAAAWAQARLNAKRPALWTALVLLGILPMGAWLAHRAPLDTPGGYGIILLLGLLFGFGTLVMTGWLLASGRDTG